MSSDLTSKADDPLSNSSSQRVLHIATLCSFAFVQPLLTVLQGQTLYLLDQQFGWAEIAIALAVILLVPSAIFAVLDLAVGRFAPRFLSNFVIFVLFAMTFLTIGRKYASAASLLRNGVAFILLFLFAISVAGIATYFYGRAKWLRMWLTVASIGIAIFPVAFLWNFHHIMRQSLATSVAKFGNPVPVVFIVFDEFSATTLVNDQMQIDRDFPGFKRLADCSTWFRNSTTVHPRTDQAVPTILSGRFPTKSRPAIESEYPGNLLQLVKSSKQFDYAIFETITRLCPNDGKPDVPQQELFLQKSFKLIQTLVIVYPRLILTADTPLDLPGLPLDWLGMQRASSAEFNNRFELTEGIFNHPGGQNRRWQLDHFLKCLKLSEKPRFAFLHVIFPHVPWVFFPGGEQYQTESTANTMPHGGAGELGEDWTDDASIVLRNQFRYRLQVRYADQFVDQVLDRLNEVGMMDQCLLIVTADHGTSFRPGHSRRIPDADNVADILSVPLFVKLPGQTQGKIDDRNVESVDLLPTVADVLKIDLPEPVDGASVFGQEIRPRKSFYFDDKMTVLEPDLPQRVAAVQKQFAIFGNKPPDELPAEVSSRPEWRGRPVKSFEIDDRPVHAKINNSLLSISEDEILVGVTLVPCLISGSLKSSELGETRAELVVAVDGVIQDSSRTFSIRTDYQLFEFFLPRSTLNSGTEKIELYLVEPSGNESRLRRVSMTE